MGKKGAKRKTRWRTLEIGTPPGEEDEEEGGLRIGLHHSKPGHQQESRHYSNSGRGGSHYYHNNHHRGGYHHQGYNRSDHRDHVASRTWSKPRHGSAGSSGSNGNGGGSTTSGYASGGSRGRAESSSESPTGHKIRFNENEYTKITTPRQDMLFKKGYLSHRKMWTPSNTSMSATPSTTESQSAAQSTADGSEAAEDQQLLDSGGSAVSEYHCSSSAPPGATSSSDSVGSATSMQLVQVGADHGAHEVGGAAAAAMQVATQPQLAAAYPAPTAYYDAASGSYYYECPMMLVPAALPADQMGCIAALPCGPMPTLRPIEWIEPGALMPAKPGTPQPGYCFVDYQTAQVTDCATLVDAHGNPLSVSASPVPMQNGHLHHHRPEQSLTGGSCCSASASASASANGSVVDEPVLIHHPSPEPQLVMCVTPSPVHLYESPVASVPPIEPEQHQQQHEEQEQVPEDEAVPSVSEPEDTATNEESHQTEQTESPVAVPVEECEVLEYAEVPSTYVETLPPQPMHLTHVIAQPMGQPYIYPGQYMFGPPLINMNGVTIQGGPMLRCGDIMMSNAAAAACVRRKKKKKKRKQRRAQAFGNTDYEDEEDYSTEGENGYSSSRVSWSASTSASHTKQQLNPECQEFRLRGEQLNPECEEFHPPTVVEYSASQEYHPTSTVEYQPTPTVEYQPASTVEYQPTSSAEYQPTPTVEYPPSSTVEYQPASVVEYQPTSTVEYQPASTVEYQTTSTVEYHTESTAEYHPTTTVEYQPSSTVEYQSTTTVEYHPESTTEYHTTSTTAEYHPAATVEYHPESTPEYHPTTTVEYLPTSSTDYHTTSTSEYHSSPASDYHAESQVEYHSASAVEYCASPVEYHAAAGVDYHPTSVTEYHTNGTTEYIPTSTAEYHPTSVSEYHPATATEYLPTSTADYHPTAATEYHSAPTAEYHTTPATEYHSTCATEYHTPSTEYLTASAAEYHPMTAVEYDTATASEYHQSGATEYHPSSAVEYDTAAPEYATAEYPECEEYHPATTEEIQYVAVPVEGDGLPTEYYSYESIPTSVPTAMPIESNGYTEIVTSVEYAEEPTEEYIPENSLAISHANNEAERLTYEESAYGDSAYHYCEQPTDVEYAQYCEYGETLDQCHQPYEGLTNGDLTIYQNGHESELVMNGDGMHYGDLQEHPHMVDQTDLQRLPPEMVNRPMSNGNGAHRRKYNSKVKYVREPTPGPDLDSQGVCCGGDMTNNTIAGTNNDDGSVEAVTEMLKSTSIAETKAPQKGGDQDNCQSWINESSITSESICNENRKTTTDLATTITKTTLTTSATDEDSGFESHTSKTGHDSGAPSSRPITDAVNEWLKRANSPDLFITSSTASDDSEDEQDDEDASVSNEPPKNLQGNPMPALSVNTGANGGRPVARDQFASSANQSTPSSSHQRAIGGTERKVSSRRSRKTKASRKKAAAVGPKNAPDFHQTPGQSDAVDIEHLQISAKPTKDSASQEKIGGTCEVIEKDSDVGMRVAENSRIHGGGQEILSCEGEKVENELKIVKSKENARKSISIGETVKTFEKGEIVVSMDGELLLVTTAPTPIMTKDSIDIGEKRDNNHSEEDDEIGVSLGSIEEPDVLECWEAEIVEPLTKVLHEDIVDDDLATISEDDNNASEHVRKYYRLQVDSCTEDDDAATDDVNTGLKDVPNTFDQSSDSEDDVLPVISEESPQSIGRNHSNVPVDEAFEVHENCYSGKSLPFDSIKHPRFSKASFFRRRRDGPIPFKNVSCNIQ